jgi:uncharacterized membrane protein YeiB
MTAGPAPLTEAVPGACDGERVRIAPIEHSQRSLAPDLARGLLLLFIAVANVWGYLYGSPLGTGSRPLDGSTADRVVNGLVSFFADDRSRPMFAILYGYGIATMAARMAARGLERRSVRKVLRRRSLLLIGLGLLHAVLLFQGDILAPYGATGLIALALVHRRRAVLLRWFWASALLMVLVLAALPALERLSGSEAVERAPTYPEAMLEGFFSSVVVTSASVVALLFVSQVIIGFMVARSGWLDRPWEHTAVLARVFWWAIGVNLVANLPYALAVARVWTPTGFTALVVDVLHIASGVLMGLGYVALFALVAARMRNTRTRVAAVVSAVGERSLTCYLLQSLMLAPLLSRWGAGLGGSIGTSAATAIAIGVWAVTVLIAVGLDRTGHRGPFEVVLRRLTYGRPAPVLAVHAADPVRAG